MSPSCGRRSFGDFAATLRHMGPGREAPSTKRSKGQEEEAGPLPHLAFDVGETIVMEHEGASNPPGVGRKCPKKPKKKKPYASHNVRR